MSNTPTQSPISGPWAGTIPSLLPAHLQPRARRWERNLERLHALREQFEAELVALLDEADGDPDLEPSLAHPEQPFLKFTPARYGMKPQTAGSADDREQDADAEPDLGGLGDAHRQRHWGGQAGPEDDGQPDLEPSLGAPTPFAHENQNHTWGPQRLCVRKYGGQVLDIDDAEDDGREAEEDEHNLGRSENVDQTHCETSADDAEWSLGSSNGPDQRHWAAEHDPSIRFAAQELEEQCEDEGGACEDEGAQSDDEGDAQAFVERFRGDSGRQVWPPLATR